MLSGSSSFLRFMHTMLINSSITGIIATLENYVNKPKGEIWLVVCKVVPVNSEYFRIINICTVMLINAAL